MIQYDPIVPDPTRECHSVGGFTSSLAPRVRVGLLGGEGLFAPIHAMNAGRMTGMDDFSMDVFGGISAFWSSSTLIAGEAHFLCRL